MEMELNSLREGEAGTITKLCVCGAMRRRFMDFGLIEGTKIRCLRRCGSGSPILYCVRGTMLALRCKDSKNIRIELCE